MSQAWTPPPGKGKGIPPPVGVGGSPPLPLWVWVGPPGSRILNPPPLPPCGCGWVSFLVGMGGSPR